MKHLKLLIIGYGRHGKDTVCEYLHDTYGYTFESSSKFCSKKFIFEALEAKYGYANEEECFNDRHNHREEWYNAICAYNVGDDARLGREIFKEYSIYCGLRNKAEFYAMKKEGVFDFSVWVDRSDHLPPEGKESMTLERHMADCVIDNNGTLEDLYRNTDKLLEHLYRQ